MSCRKMIFWSVVLLALFSGCGLKEGVVQTDTKSFLWFTGDTQNAEVFIDDLDTIVLDAVGVGDVDQRGKNKKEDKVYYEISPGKHTIIVKKSGEVVVHRNVLIGNGLIKEIRIP